MLKVDVSLFKSSHNHSECRKDQRKKEFCNMDEENERERHLLLLILQ